MTFPKLKYIYFIVYKRLDDKLQSLGESAITISTNQRAKDAESIEILYECLRVAHNEGGEKASLPCKEVLITNITLMNVKIDWS